MQKNSPSEEGLSTLTGNGLFNAVNLSLDFSTVNGLKLFAVQEQSRNTVNLNFAGQIVNAAQSIVNFGRIHVSLQFFHIDTGRSNQFVNFGFIRSAFKFKDGLIGIKELALFVGCQSGFGCILGNRRNESQRLENDFDIRIGFGNLFNRRINLVAVMAGPSWRQRRR